MSRMVTVEVLSPKQAVESRVLACPMDQAGYNHYKHSPTVAGKDPCRECRAKGPDVAKPLRRTCRREGWEL